MDRTASPVMVGRAAELDRLEAALGRARAGESQAVVVSGEAGIGKTRLVEEFLTGVPADVLVLVGRCLELGTAGTPFVAVRGVLRDLIDALGREAVLAAAGSGVDALGALLPDAGSSAGDDAPAEQLHEAVLVLLERVAEDRPLVVVVEDVHWADIPTLRLLHYCARMLRDAAVLLVLTARDGEADRDDPVRRILPELRRAAGAAAVELDRLSREEVAEMVAGTGAAIAGAELDRLHARAAGIPFLVEELLGSPDGPVPSSLADVVRLRYDRASPGTRDVLRLAAVAGQRVPHDLLATAASDADLDAAMREAVSLGILVADASGYEFRHALLREVIDADCLPGERARFHATIAAALSRLPARPGAQAEISTHWLHARRFPEAFEAAVRARPEARSGFAYATAAAMGERCIDLWDAVEDPEKVAGMPLSRLILETAADHQSDAVGERAVAILELGLRVATDAPLLRAEMLQDIGQYTGIMGRPGSIPALRAALDALPDDEHAETLALRARILGNLASRILIEEGLEPAIPVGQQAYEAGLAAGPASHRHAAVGAMAIGTAIVETRQEEGLEWFAEARRLTGSEWKLRCRYLINYSNALTLIGRAGEAAVVAQEGVEEARERAEERSTGTMLATNAVDALFTAGDWDSGATLLHRALRFDSPLAWRAHLWRSEVWWLLWTGDVDGATRRYDAIRAEYQAFARLERQVEFPGAAIFGWLALARGDVAAAWDLVEPVMRAGGLDRLLDRLAALAVAARVLVHPPPGVDAQVEAEAVRTRAAELGEAIGIPFWPLLVEAELSVLSGTSELAAWSAVVVAGDDPRVPPHLRGYVAIREAEALLAVGRVDDARTRIAEAEAIARRLGSGLILDDAAAVARRFRPERAAGDHSLTARESEVLALIARGHSNARIGRELFISAKTVSVHVSAILRKLGVATRTEAALVFERGSSGGDP